MLMHAVAHDSCTVYRHPKRALEVKLTLGDKSLATSAHKGRTDTIRESALKVNSGRKLPCHTGDSNQHQYYTWLFSWMLYQLSYSGTSLSMSEPLLLPKIKTKNPIYLHKTRPDECWSDERDDEGSQERGQEVDAVVIQQWQASDVLHVRTGTLHNFPKFTAVPWKMHAHIQKNSEYTILQIILVSVKSFSSCLSLPLCKLPAASPSSHFFFLSFLRACVRVSEWAIKWAYPDLFVSAAGSYEMGRHK